MRIGGVEIKGPNQEVLVLPRGEQQIIIRAQSVLDMDTFDKLCPEPKAPGRRTKDGFVPNPDDPSYKDMLNAYQSKRLAYLVIQSLKPSEIEWDTVREDNPSTWDNYLNDLKAGGLSNIEINRIIVCVMQANSLDESKLEAARKLFLAGQAQAANESSGQNSELATTPSGEPVKG